MGASNFFVVSREEFENEFWKEPRKWSFAECWLWMNGTANWKESFVFIEGEKIRVERGELLTSIGALASKWGCSEGTVKRRLAYLAKEQKVALSPKRRCTVIRLLNYEAEQTLSPAGGSLTDTQTVVRQTTSEPGNQSTKKPDLDLESGVFVLTLAGRKNLVRRFSERAVDWYLPFINAKLKRSGKVPHNFDAYVESFMLEDQVNGKNYFGPANESARRQPAPFKSDPRGPVPKVLSQVVSQALTKPTKNDGGFMKAVLPVVLFVSLALGVAGCTTLRAIEGRTVRISPAPLPPTVDQLVREIAPKYGVPISLLRALVEQESRGNPTARREERHHMKYARRYSKDPETQRELASSHGLCQIMGWVAFDEYNTTPRELRDPRINLEVCSAKLRKLYDQAKKNKAFKSTGERWAVAVDRFNGATNQHARRVFARMIELS